MEVEPGKDRKTSTFYCNNYINDMDVMETKQGGIIWHLEN